MRRWSRISPGFCEAGSAVTPESRECRAEWRTECHEVQCPKSCACDTGKIYSRIVRTKIQHLLPEAAKGRQSGWIKGGSASVPQIVLSFFIEKMRKERKCVAVLFTDIKAAFYSVFAEIALGGLLPLDTRGGAFRQSRVELPSPTGNP